MEDFLNGIGRAFSSSPAGRPAGTRSRPSDSLIAGLAVAHGGAARAHDRSRRCRSTCSALARWTSLATLAASIVVKLVDEPGANVLKRAAHGLLIALGAAAVLVASAMSVAAAPQRRTTVAKTYTPPVAPVYEPDSSYGPPQY